MDKRKNIYREWALESLEVINQLYGDIHYLFCKYENDYYNVNNLVNLNIQLLEREIRLLKGYLVKYEKAYNEVDNEI